MSPHSSSDIAGWRTIYIFLHKSFSILQIDCYGSTKRKIPKIPSISAQKTTKMTTNCTDTSLEDVLYHVLVEIIDYHKDQSGATRTIEVLKTYTSLPAAKAAAHACLTTLGYLPSDFDEYAEKSDADAETWAYGDGCLVYTKAPAGQVFYVRLDTTPPPQGMELKVDQDGTVEGPLYYVLQTNIDYNADRVGGKESTSVEAVFGSRHEACDMAYRVLLDPGEGITKESFAEYDEFEEEREEWPWGGEVLVHAVGENGENFLVSVKGQMNPKRS